MASAVVPMASDVGISSSGIEVCGALLVPRKSQLSQQL